MDTKLKPNQFKCAMCGEIFEKALSDEEVLEEARLNDFDPDDCDLVCDDCYKIIGSEYAFVGCNHKEDKVFKVSIAPSVEKTPEVRKYLEQIEKELNDNADEILETIVKEILFGNIHENPETI